jgi:hypothetical protein
VRRAMLMMFITVRFTFAWSPLNASESVTTEPVRLKPDQLDVLKAAVRSTNERKQKAWFEFKKLESQNNPSKFSELYLYTASDTERDLKKTQSAFESLLKTNEERRAAQIFFSDIQTFYSETKVTVQKLPTTKYTLFRDNTFQLLDYTQTAYYVVARDGSLTFDLDVQSSPPQAKILFKRQGEEYLVFSRLTNTIVKNLVYARWFFRLELDGYYPENKMFDPYHEPSLSLNITLRMK